MPLDVVAAPHSEGREHGGSASSAPPACDQPAGSAPAIDPDKDDLAIPDFLDARKRRQTEAVA
jgi:hypothetical protein